MNKIPSMSELGHALASVNGTVIHRQLDDAIRASQARLANEARRGLSKEAFEDNKEAVHAFACASLILQSIALFHQSQK